MSTAPGAKPPVSIDSEEAKRPTGSDGEARCRAVSISDGVASPVGSWETELNGRPQAEQYRPLSETSAEQEGHFIVAIVIPSTLPLPGGEGESVTAKPGPTPSPFRRGGPRDRLGRRSRA